jgi:hypothetical protein
LASCLALLSQKYPDLALVVNTWPSLPEPTRKQIIETAKAALGGGPGQ